MLEIIVEKKVLHNRAINPEAFGVVDRLALQLGPKKAKLASGNFSLKYFMARTTVLRTRNGSLSPDSRLYLRAESLCALR